MCKDKPVGRDILCSKESLVKTHKTNAGREDRRKVRRLGLKVNLKPELVLLPPKVFNSNKLLNKNMGLIKKIIFKVMLLIISRMNWV